MPESICEIGTNLLATLSYGLFQWYNLPSFFFDVAGNSMNRVPSETRTHLYSFASLAC